MSTVTENLSVEDLTAALRAQSEGYLPGEAAVELLAEHGDWLAHHVFRRFVDYEDDPEITGRRPLAGIRWSEAVAALDTNEVRVSSTAERILRIAASLGGGVPVDLRENATNSLGPAHAACIIDAISHATGG